MSNSVIGRRINKVDALSKSKGSARYIDDLKFPNMLHGKLLRSPYAHAKVVNIDTSKAEELEGVEVILTPKDCPASYFNMAGFPPGGDEFPLIKDQKILTDHPIFVGDPICAVAATSLEIAQKAIKLIKVDYEVLPSVFDPEEAMKEESLQFKENGNIISKSPMEWGDVSKGFGEADIILENRYTTQKVYQATIEPTSGSIAMFDDRGKLTVYSPTQMLHLVRGIVADAMDMRHGDIRVIKPHVGGGFGSRLGAVVEPYVALLAKKTGKPVKLIYTREEAITCSEQRHPLIMYVKMGFKNDGTITALEMKNIANTGAYATHGPSIAGITGAWAASMFKMPNVKVMGYAVCTNTMYNGAYRGYGNPQATWAIENHMDIAAEKLGLDPLEIRLKNGLKAGEPWAWTHNMFEIESCGFEECVKKGAESIGWSEKRGKGNTGSVKKRGIGMATMVHVSGAKPGLLELSGAFIKMNEDGTANLIIGNPDIGQGSTTALMQICAEELGLNFEDILVEIDAVDTSYTLFDIGSHASRQLYSGGNAVKKAASEARGKLFKIASEMLEESVENLDAKNGRIFVKDNPEKHVTHKDVSFRAHFTPNGSQIYGVSSENPPGNPPVFAAQFAEVEVDTETGEIKVINFAAAHDTGTVINPTLVEGQIEGALHHGIGYALTEETQICMETGKVLNHDFANYKILTALDMPHVDPIVVDSAPSKTASHGQKSIGESGLVPTAAAIGNAVYDAIGVRIVDLPITPQKILKALSERNS